MRLATRQRLRLAVGTELSFVTAGDASRPALLLLHGFPSSARTFREVVPELSRLAYVIAPDLPGFGESDVLPLASFAAFGQAISELLDRLSIGPRFVYLHDFGAPVGFHVAMQAPERVLGLVVQNANAHRTGFGPQWAGTLAYWSQPTAENEAAATAHLTFEGTRDQYLAGVPQDVAAGKARRLLRPRRDPVLDAGSAEDGGPRSRRRALPPRDARCRGRLAHARLHPAVRTGRTAASEQLGARFADE
jgi:pimeloyl-ACP methyl ester carboxylesterase